MSQCLWIGHRGAQAMYAMVTHVALQGEHSTEPVLLFIYYLLFSNHLFYVLVPLDWTPWSTGDACNGGNCGDLEGVAIRTRECIGTCGGDCEGDAFKMECCISLNECGTCEY